MATKFSKVAKATNSTASNASKGTKKTSSKVNPKPSANSIGYGKNIDTTGLTRWQRYRLGKRQIELEKMKVNTRPEIVKAAGQAFSNVVTSPIITKIASNAINENAASRRQSAAQSALAQWNSLLDGDPENETKENSKGEGSVLGG